MTILVTGGAGFIGSNFLHHLTSITEDRVVVIDKLSYASNKKYIPASPQFHLEECDLFDENQVRYIFTRFKPRTVFHFAAESHVDNSIKDCKPFVESNIIGTINLLNASLVTEVERFQHISTDEVFGSIPEGSFTEDTKYDPRNPYSASKAASDHFVNAFHNTYGLPVVVTNCSNNYGPRQYREKLVPKIITNLLQNRKIPVYGDGQQIRDWLYVQDHCEALIDIWRYGKVGEKYNIGGECEITNLDLVKRILSIMNKDESMIEYVKDRPGHDRRYSTDISKIKTEIGWSPRYNLDIGLEKTVSWYTKNNDYN
jgi:dTDP-glucose 4,6-dehydratase